MPNRTKKQTKYIDLQEIFHLGIDCNATNFMLLVKEGKIPVDQITRVNKFIDKVIYEHVDSY